MYKDEPDKVKLLVGNVQNEQLLPYGHSLIYYKLVNNMKRSQQRQHFVHYLLSAKGQHSISAVPLTAGERGSVLFNV